MSRCAKSRARNCFASCNTFLYRSVYYVALFLIKDLRAIKWCNSLTGTSTHDNHPPTCAAGTACSPTKNAAPRPPRALRLPPPPSATSQVELDPRNAVAHCNLGVVLEDQKAHRGFRRSGRAEGWWTWGAFGGYVGEERFWSLEWGDVV